MEAGPARDTRDQKSGKEDLRQQELQRAAGTKEATDKQAHSKPKRGSKPLGEGKEARSNGGKIQEQDRAKQPKNRS